MGSTQVDGQSRASVVPDDLQIPEELGRRKLRTRLLFLSLIVIAVVAGVTLLPGLDSLRTRLAHAQPGWLALGVGLKVLSGLGYVAIFRMVFCRRMSWRVSYQIGMSELGANALLPTGGAGGLALGAWALKRGGMPASEIARRTAAFFLLTSVANVRRRGRHRGRSGRGGAPGRDEPRADARCPRRSPPPRSLASLLAGRTAAGLHRRLQATKQRRVLAALHAAC